jgi:predicted O-methyltransferase YrrM
VKKLAFLFKYIRYLLFAKNAHGIHSPFVFELYNEVINKETNYYAFDRIELLRNKLLFSKAEIDVKDLGTGRSGKRKIREIAERSAKNKKYGELLYRIVHRFKPDVILELGTSIGISTAYLASANPNAKVITIEGCPNTAAAAKKCFNALELINIQNVVGNFDTELSDIIGNLCQLPTANRQLVFFDGNHCKEPTLRYFTQCLELANNDSVFVFDDIHWSDEMEEAWEEIKKHPKVTVTIDLFFLGIVFFRKEQVKENFILRV